MTDPDEPEHRAYHHPDPDRVELRDVDEPEDGRMVIRMPISSTAEARDGDAFDTDRLRGYAEQINEGNVPAFLDHGLNRDVSDSRYSSTGKVGMLRNAELAERDDGTTDLVVDKVLMDPETLPAATGGLREHMARIKAQVERDIPLTASIGWTDSTGDRDVPGDSDLVESSLVGIPSDPNATQDAGEAAEAMARAAVTGRGDDVDREALVEQFRAVVMGPDPDAGDGARDTDSMTDDDSSSGGEPDDTNDDAQDGVSDERFEEMLDLQRDTLETLNALASLLREDGDDDDMDDDEDEEEDDEDEDDDDDGDMNSADDDDTDERTLQVGDEELTAEDVRELRTQLNESEPDAGDDGDGEDDERDSEPETSSPKELLK